MFILNSAATAVTKKGNVAFVKGNNIFTHSKKIFTQVWNYKFTSTASKAYKDRAGALNACISKTGCKGVEKRTGKYYLATDSLLTPSKGVEIFILGGDVVQLTTVTISYGGYSWTMEKPVTLGGKYSKKAFTKRNKALKACAKATKCNGVVRHKAETFHLHSGSTSLPGKGKVAYTKNGKAETLAGVIWTKKTGMKLKGSYSKKKYTTLKKALKACAADDGCKGVTKFTAGNFRLRSTSASVRFIF